MGAKLNAYFSLYRKVLKEISVGELKPNETVQANLEAQLLSQLNHPTIVRFYTSFLEHNSFCIITEYCEGRDLDCKINECKEAGKTFPESQVLEWFIQLLLGVHYTHERRILHRDLKTKNIFLKNNIVKIGDFGVSCLLMGSCDLATTFTGTPYYMSPEALNHQGYNSKSDIWSLACILYEMCCLDHAFTGNNFLSVVLKIVEGKTPSLPDRYSKELNSIMERFPNALHLEHIVGESPLGGLQAPFRVHQPVPESKRGFSHRRWTLGSRSQEATLERQWQAHCAASPELQFRRTTQLWAAYGQALQGSLVRGETRTPWLT
ncbi:serine/threonine-protein kinase Nek11-like [Polyodon spathula]|uniref:serine/threonine-protein kinase Nek11-like n=1 Tax=Polyodon spathula TaxID=7913 RepID=UPI001B7DD591|nr:serine/threonine-protein kinase Nek11-like [Polyodon spathula]